MTPEARSPPSDPSAVLRPMELAEVQTLMDRLYGDADRERGVPATVAWLCEELGELAQAVRKGTRAQQVHEFGDVLAWLASLANQCGITLDEAMERYVNDPDRKSVV